VFLKPILRARGSVVNVRGNFRFER